MPLIGITGGLGTGKSTVLSLFAERGAVTLSADEAAREVLGPGSPALAEVVDFFGPEICRPDGSLDRARLAERVFADPEARTRLEEITHPRILQLLRARIDEARRAAPNAVIVVEAPLLYEAGMESWFDYVVVVTSSREQQVARAMARSGMTREEAESRIAAQMPLGEKTSRAEFAIANDGVLSDLHSQVDRVLASVFSTR